MKKKQGRMCQCSDKEDCIHQDKMVADGFPLCYRENGVDLHCDVCIKSWKLKKLE